MAALEPRLTPSKPLKLLKPLKTLSLPEGGRGRRGAAAPFLDEKRRLNRIESRLFDHKGEDESALPVSPLAADTLELRGQDSQVFVNTHL